MTSPAPASPDRPAGTSDSGAGPGQYVPGPDVPLRQSTPATDEDHPGQDDPPGGQDGAGDDDSVPL
jgi:hypothetical protein